MKIYAFADEASPIIDLQIKAMLENRLDGIEIRNVDDVNISDISIAKANEVSKKLKDNNLSVWSIGSPIGKIDIEKDDFKTHIEKFRRTLEIANVLESKNIRLFSFFIPKDKNPDGYKNEVIDRLGILLEYAKNSDIDLCHENEKGIFGDTPERCLEIYKALPKIKNIFDPANYVQCNVDTLKAWELLKDFTKYLHIKDALSDGNVVPAGKGVGNIKSIVCDYLSLGNTAVTIEPHLSVFSGLSSLEQEDEKSVVGEIYKFKDNETAFYAGVEAFKGLF